MVSIESRPEHEMLRVHDIFHMLDWLAQYTLISSTSILWMAALGALCIGMSKVGLGGVSMLSVLLFAEAFGAKASTGLVLPMLLFSDVIGYMLLKRGGSWKQILPLLPPAMIGIVLGWYWLDQWSESQARVMIGALILMLLTFKLLIDFGKSWFEHVKRSHCFKWISGISAGIATMLANAAGPVMSSYLLTQQFSKADYLGVFSRFFLFINIFKIPFSTQIGLIYDKTLLTNACLIPCIMLGSLIGWSIVKRIPPKPFEWLMFFLALFAALRLIF